MIKHPILPHTTSDQSLQQVTAHWLYPPLTCVTIHGPPEEWWYLLIIKERLGGKYFPSGEDSQCWWGLRRFWLNYLAGNQERSHRFHGTLSWLQHFASYLAPALSIIYCSICSHQGPCCFSTIVLLCCIETLVSHLFLHRRRRHLLL